MSKLQRRAYRKIEEPEVFGGPKRRSNALRSLERQISNFLFPPDEEHPYGMVGNRGFAHWVNKDGRKYTLKPEFRRILRTKLPDLSPVFQEIIDRSLDQPGIDWVFSNYDNSGATLFSLILKEQEVEEFRRNKSVFVSRGSKIQYCVTRGVTRKISSSFPKKPRYAVLLSDTPVEERVVIMELLNSYENRHGEYIKYIIGSPLTRDGINIFNVARIHFQPSWNRSATYQAESRALRVTGFRDLLQELQEQHPDRIPEIVVKVNAYGAVYDPAAVEAPVTLNVDPASEINIANLGHSTGSVELDMYIISEVKDIKLKRIDRLMDRASLDCALNYARNAQPGEDGSVGCAYAECEYTCMDYDGPITEEDVAEFGSDKSAYLSLYADEMVPVIQRSLHDVFSRVSEATLASLYDYLPQYETRFIDLAIFKMAQDKVTILNRYGFKNYVALDQSRAFLIPSFDQSQNVSGSYYGHGLILKDTKSFDQFLAEKRLPEQEKLTSRFRKAKTNSALTKSLAELSNEHKVSLLEEAIVARQSGDKLEPWQKFIYDTYRSHIYTFHEPVTEIENNVEFLGRTRKQGRPRKDRNLIRIKDVFPPKKRSLSEFVQDEDTEEVYVHNLTQILREAGKKTQFAAMSQLRGSEVEKDIRLFKPSEGKGFRNPSNVENPAYAILIKLVLDARFERFEREAVYGSMIKNVFRISDQINYRDTGDSRQRRRGRDCTTFEADRLLRILKYLELEPESESSDLPDVDEMREYIRGKIKSSSQVIDLDAASDEDIRQYYIWLDEYSRPDLCSIVFDELKKRDLIEYQ